MLTVLLKTLSIFIIIGFGYVIRRRGMIDAAFNRMLAAVLINVFYPTLILNSLIRNFSLSEIARNWSLPVGVFGLMLLGWTVGLPAARMLRGATPETRRMFHFQSSINNYSFLPIMLASMLWTASMREHTIARLVFSSLGAEIFVWTLGIQAITGKLALDRTSLRHLLSMPMLAMLFAFLIIGMRDVLLAGAPFETVYPGAAWVGAIGEMVLDTFQITGQATIPVSGIIVGSRMAGLHPTHLVTRRVGAVTLLRLAVIPGLAVAAFILLPLTQDVRETLFLVAIMPCALTSVTLAEVYRIDADFAAASVLTTHIACLVTIPVWLRLLGVA